MNQRVDDDIAHEPMWDEIAQSYEVICEQCDVAMAFDTVEQYGAPTGYPRLWYQCPECGERDYVDMGPDPDKGHDSKY